VSIGSATPATPMDAPLRRRRPVLGFLGIHAGKRTDQPVSQNETLAALFEEAGYQVRRSSAVKRPSLRTAHQILSILAWRDVDLMVIAGFSGRSFLISEFSSWLGGVTGKRLVLFLHGGNLPVYGPEHRRRVERVLNRVDLVLAPSEYLADTFRSWGYDVRVIPNVLSIEQYEYRPRTAARTGLLWMRTFHEHYDPVMAVRVLARVRERHPDAHLTMGGVDQGMLGETKAEVERLGLVDHVEFAGYMLADAKREAFAANDIFLNTNTVDNMPVSLLEVCASGMVPVATNVGGIPALLTDGVDADLVPSGDVDAMADAVLRLIAEPERFAAMSVAARQLAERSAWPSVYRRWVEELTLVLPDGGLDPDDVREDAA